MRVLAFAASNSVNSINKKLATYAGSLLQGVELEVLDLNDYEMPLFSIDKEVELGQPEPAKQFLSKIGDSDAVIVSFAEHNGNYSAAYKNVFDWCSRINGKIFQEKPMLVLATSPGARGGTTVLDIALKALPRFAADIRGHLSVPNFDENFDEENGRLSHVELDQELKSLVEKLR